MSVLPLYTRIATDLRDRIAAGDLPPHAPIASERRLSEQFGVSRMTARQALDVLERDGYVYRLPARGTYVAEPRISVRVGGFSDELRRVGRRPGATLLHREVTAPTSPTAAALGLSEGEQILVTRRLRSADGLPLAIETSSWPLSRFPELARHAGDGSLWAWIRERYGVVAAETDARLEAVTLADEDAGPLGAAAGSAGFLLTRRTFDTDGRCFELARDVYRGDRSEFRVRVPVEQFDADAALLTA